MQNLMTDKDYDSKHYQTMYTDAIRSANQNVRLAIMCGEEDRPTKMRNYAKAAAIDYRIARYFYNLFLHS
jgi:hypothetical protein